MSEVYPGAVFIIASWYRKFEMARRISLFYMAALLASGFGPIVSFFHSCLCLALSNLVSLHMYYPLYV